MTTLTTSLVDIDATPVFDHLLDIRITFESVHAFATPLGTRMNYVVKQGRCIGPRIAADVLPGGGDWVLLGTDGVARLDVRATLRTDDGAVIQLTNTGRVQMDRAAADRFAAGELIRHDEMTARSSPLFETGDERYRWLNAVHTVAINQVSLSEVHYRVFAVG
ncbi:hypothetical protein BA059_12985 [Mycolicibacterium sp. (ex Dasyatis americana)]|uniref:UPF0311 protein BKG61_16050 n=1 Tax=Mycobacterium syngnathidarum TaxID=1908205 RepID=A0A1S1K1J4_9MYCO|nr:MULTISPECIES: DUF3237 domain-containing protein [Mycobacterium]OFB39106.1 hypothetical protein BA059_12985 [Mycolicibacterium sp. (ex Dasyatis americana)]MCG7609467.1 DUF3237 domain-containing protein [Mycobacterium sp. CnD-18-1]OHT97465.1 hypothetical protein BKG61_16050 [Mycobacterium syngnathidarum]OLT91326.1 hypothetical protein BKG60_22090 [Mycobacterium syngnathidarum]TMS54296.1 DUF3237 domain-containing protein [Mycobacterium sp. DBP42]